MAATIRTSMRVGRVPPSRSTCPSCSTRSSLGCNSSGSSPISSRKTVPPLASSKRPACAVSAPVKAPRSWPKSSLSISDPGSAPQSTTTKLRLRRGLRWWIARATSSLPVPVSPRRSTAVLVGGDLIDAIHHVLERVARSDDRIIGSQPLGGRQSGSGLAGKSDRQICGHRERLGESGSRINPDGGKGIGRDGRGHKLDVGPMQE